MRVMGAQHPWLGWEPSSGDPHLGCSPSQRVSCPPPAGFPTLSNGCSSSQRRGLVVAADRTELLYQQGYWASYNLP